MVKHNNVIPNQHFHKDWQNRVKTWFNQPARKKRRRLARKAKAAAIAPRPAAGLLRPVVRCPTLKYNMKVRTGRGFTLEELKGAGVNPKQARSIGIAVDFRRTNKSVESLQANIERLKEYKAKLMVFPLRNRTKPKAGDASPEETSQAVQFVGAIQPVSQASIDEAPAAITEEMKNSQVFIQLRQERANARLVGVREVRAKAKAEAAALKASKKKK
jgi:large subunit ribosomal protein L13e